MRETKKIILSKLDAEALRVYCRGCQYFSPKKEVRHICSIVGWYNENNIGEVLEYVKHCPCNKKCLVKASCRDEDCPMWVDYVKQAAMERNKHLLEEKCKEKKSHAAAASNSQSAKTKKR
jgi:hypothetical protein